MISDKLLKELKTILKEDYQMTLPDKELRAFAENIKGLSSVLVKALQKKENKIKLIINKNKNENSNTQQN